MNSAKQLISFLAFMLISLSSFSQSLTTTFASNNSFDGNMFDVTASNQINICAFDVNVSHPVGSTVNLAVYWKSGTHVGFESDPGAWTILGEGSAISAGIDSPTFLSVGGLTIDAGNTVALYVTLDGASLNQNSDEVMGYANGTAVGNVLASNSDLTIFEGTGKGGLFDVDFTFAPRVWNGTIYYSLGGSSTLVDCYLDSDGDDFGDPDNPRTFCTTCGPGYVLDNTDCDDNNDAVNPSATEICDLVDNDCDGEIDEGFTVVTCYLDSDNDNFGNPNQPLAFCTTCGPGYVTDNTDCDDSNSLIFPGAVISPVNTVGYQICPGGFVLPGEGVTAYPPYQIGGNYSNSSPIIISDGPPASYSGVVYVPSSFAIADLNVDLQITHTWVGDLKISLTAPDGTTVSQLFDQPGGSACSGCSGDNMSVVFDDNALLTANDFENTCNNLHAILGTYQPIDPLSLFNGLNAQGDWTLTVSDECELDGGSVDNWTLQFEGLGSISWWDAPVGGTQLATGEVFDPTSIPLPAGVDPNQPGTYPYWAQFDDFPACATNQRVQVDFVVEFLPGQSLMTWYKDTDDDGLTDGATVQNCVQPPGYKLQSELANSLLTDCDDNDPFAFPGQTWYQDADGDYYSNGAITTSCLRPPGYIAASELLSADTDCDDNDANTNPGAAEICDGKDNNCNGTMDEGAPSATYVGNITFSTQAQVDAWSACYNVIQGALTIMGGNINNLGPLSNIGEVTGNVLMYSNSTLTTLNGLDNLATVGGGFYMYYNFQLANCCAIDDLLTNNGVAGPTVIFYNFFGSHCNSEAAIEAACPIPLLVGNPNNPTANPQLPSLKVGKTINLYPNPARNEVNILFDRTAPTAQLRIMDMLGRVVFEMEMEEGMDRLTIDLNSGQFENGIYLVSILEDGEMRVKQLVVQQ